MPLRDDLLNPISGANPSGENLRYAPVYDQIKEARREEAEVAQGEWQTAFKKADWVQVVKLAGDALAKKSKDLQLAAWLTEGITRREGFGGLKAGLDLVRGLLENFWDTLYPEIEDGDLELRAAPVDWIGSRLDETVKRVPLTRGGYDWFSYKESRTVPHEEDTASNEAKAQLRATALEEGKLTPEQFDEQFSATPAAFYEQANTDLDGCLESLKALKEVADQKFGDVSPNLTGLEKTLEEVKQVVRVLLVKKKPAEPEGAEGEVSTTEMVEEAGDAGSAAAAPARAKARRAPTAEPADYDDAAERLEVVARWWRQQDYYSPAPYLLLRGVRWGELRAGGAGTDPDPSLLVAPPTEVRQNLKKLFNEADYAQVIEVGEAAMATPAGRAWLDLQRYVVKALENQGYEAVAAAIRSELKALVADLPNLVDLTLTDDTPTANAETRTWIKEITAPPPGEDYWAEPAAPAAPKEVEGGEGFGEEAPPDPYQLAMDAVRSGNFNEAVGILSREAAVEVSGRGRFQRRVQLAQVCLGANRFDMALPILQDLLKEIDRRELEGWEAPDTIAHTFALLYRSMAKMDVPQEEKLKIYARICRLDPVQALSLAR